MTLMKEAASFLGLRTGPHAGRHFHDMDLNTRVVLSQLPLGICVLVTAIVLALVRPTLFDAALTQAGFAVVVLMTAAASLLPWDRLPPLSYTVIPLLDFVGIGLIWQGTFPAVRAVGLLAVFPVFWLTWSGLRPLTALVLSFTGPLAMVWLPVALTGSGRDAGLLSRGLLPLILLGIGVCSQVMSSSMTDRQRALQRQAEALERQATALARKDAELRQALERSQGHEQLLDAMVEAVGIGLLAVDAGGHDVLMNRRQRHNHLLAAPPGNPDPAEADLLLFEADRVTPIPIESRPVFLAVRGETINNRLIWAGTGEGQRAISVSAHPMRDQDGGFAGSVIAFNDVTDLLTALSVKDDFVAGVSHELRTPLTSIIGYLDLVLEDDDDAGRLPAHIAEGLRVSLRNAERLLALVTELLTSVSGTLDIHPTDTCMASVFRSCMASVEPVARRAGVVLVDELPTSLPAWVDPARLTQVGDNLLSNAVKYSPGGGTVTVQGWSAGGATVLQVRDTGMGMSSEEVDQLGTRFFRSRAARRAAIPGVGLGLAITKNIVNRHGGRLECRSEPGAGTVFTITLPAHGN